MAAPERNRRPGADSTPTAPTPQRTDPRVLFATDREPPLPVTVRWPDGELESFALPQLGSYHTLVRGQGKRGRQRPDGRTLTGPRRSSARVDAAVAAATAATLALLLPFDQTAAAQQAMESVALPRTEQFEQVVQDQLAAAQRNVERLEADADASEAERAAAFGLLGQLYLLYDFPGPAAAALRNAEALEPTDVRWPYYLAELATNEGDHAAAAVALDRALSLQPENLAALLRRGNALFELGRLEDAEKDYRHVLHRVAGQTAALHGLGRIAYERGEHDQAIELLEAAASRPAGGIGHPPSAGPDPAAARPA